MIKGINEMNSISEKIRNATKWSTISEIFAKLVTPITNMVLARVISPEAFGVVATVTMVMSFADMFTDAGFQKYLVQHEFKDEKEKIKSANVAFWTNLAISIMILLFIVLFRERIAILVGNPGLGNIISIACIQLLLTSFSSIQMALYRRDLNFKALFLVRMVSVAIPFLVTIPLGFLGFSYWSIIIGNIITQILNATILTVKSKWRPYFFYDINLLKEMISFSIWSLIEAISIWFTSWIDVFIISSALNQHYLGIYKTSTTMVNSLMSLITASIVPVFFSALSRLQNDDDKFNKIYLNTQRIISIFVFPLGVGIYLYSDLATEIMLGNGWEEASYVIGIWALTSAIMIVFGNLNSEVYRAKGKPKLSFIAQILHLIVLVPVCIISSKYSFSMLVYSRAWIRLELVLVHLIIMKFAIGFPIKEIFKVTVPSGISVLIMGILGLMLKQISDGLIWSIISIIVCTICYFGVLYLFPSMKKYYKNIYNKIKYKMPRNKKCFVNR